MTDTAHLLAAAEARLAEAHTVDGLGQQAQRLALAVPGARVDRGTVERVRLNGTARVSACQRIEQPTPVVYADDTHGFGDGGRTAGELVGGSPAAAVTVRVPFDDWCDAGHDAVRIIAAFHEAGHAVIGHVAGETPVAVSIRPTDRYHGVAIYDPDGPAHPEHESVAGEMPCREWIERQMLIIKAGAQAEALLHDIPVEQVIPISAASASDQRAEQRFEASLASLGGRARELLRQAASAPALRDDWTQANELAVHFARAEARSHSLWMSAVTSRLVLDNWPAIEAVATALLQEEVISGQRVAELCREINQ